MHTMRQSEPNLWTVGCYWVGEDGRTRWRSLKDFGTQTDAAKWVNYLNGGNSCVDVCIIAE